MKKYKLAIVGATGLVGRTALKILEEKNIQNLEYTLFSSKKSAGTELKFMNTRYLVHELKDFSFDEHFDFARPFSKSCNPSFPAPETARYVE